MLAPSACTRQSCVLQLRYLGVTLINLAAGVAFRWYLKPGIPVQAINLLITGWAFLIYTLYKVRGLAGCCCA